MENVTVELTRKEAMFVLCALAPNNLDVWRKFFADGFTRSGVPWLSEGELATLSGFGCHDLNNEIHDKLKCAIGKTTGECVDSLCSGPPVELGCRRIRYTSDGIDLGDDYKLTPKQLRAMADKCEEA